MSAYLKKFCLLLCLCFTLGNMACAMQAQKRGLVGQEYISTSSPALAMSSNLNFIAYGEGNARLYKGGATTGLDLDSWYTIYADQASNPQTFAILALAELPYGWYWDSSMEPFGAIRNKVELINDWSFSAWTRLIRSQTDIFMNWTNPDLMQDKKASAKLWIARTFAKRMDFDRAKVLLEYREVVPQELAANLQGVEIMSEAYLGSEFLEAFEARARQALKIRKFEANETKPEGKRIFLSGPRWRYADDSFWGTASPRDIIRPN